MLSGSIAALRGVKSSLRHMAGGNRALNSSFLFSQGAGGLLHFSVQQRPREEFALVVVQPKRAVA